MKKFLLLFVAATTAFSLYSQSIADFENVTLATDTFTNGSDLSGGFSSGSAFFNNVYDTAFGGYWSSGFAISNMHGNALAPSDTPFTNALEFSAVTGKGYGNSANYAVGYDDGMGSDRVRLTSTAKGGIVNGFYATNSLYAYLSMWHGDAFETAFSYTNADWFELNITGWHGGVPIGDTVHFYLADFRTPNSPGIVMDWQWISLIGLGDVDSLVFSLASSQTGQFGINTPAYFCIDNFTTADATFAAYNSSASITYQQDVTLDILPNLVAGNSISPLTVKITNGPLIPGASAVVLGGDSIWYLPTDGVVATDTVTFQVCDTNGYCSTGQIVYTISGPTTINGVASSPSIKILPNPFSNSFKVTYEGDFTEMRLFDMQGRLLKVISAGNLANNIEVNAVGLDAGTYFARIITDKGSSIAKLVKQ